MKSMPFKRPAPVPNQSESESSTSQYFKRRRQSHILKKALPNVKVYIVHAKLDVATLVELNALADKHAEQLCRNAEDADVILTAVGMRKRLERHVPWSIAESKAIVTPDWLRHSVQQGRPLPCGDYAACPDLYVETVRHCPDCNCKPCACSPSSASSVIPSSPALEQSHSATSSSSPPRPVQDTPAHLLPPDPPIPTDPSKLSHTSRYACQRASPLICPNQELVEELDIIRRSRTLEGEARSALSYERAASILKACPHRISSVTQAEKLPYIGAKVASLIEEYLEEGKIGEARSIQASERFQTLTLFSSIYGIGPNTARKLHGLGLRSLEDLEIYYGVNSNTARQDVVKGEIIEVEERQFRYHGKLEGGEGDEGLGDNWIRIALEIREDLAIKIPRDEVEEMGRVVMHELGRLQSGCVSTIVGGYRRGKPASNDVDIVFTHPDPSKVKGLCKRLVRRLHDQGMVTHVMHLSGFHGHNPLRTTHWDSLEKALTVFILPKSSSFASGLRRRLDLIFAPPEVYWTAVIGWSGSIMFQRDLRQWAKDTHAMKFDSSGITRRYDSKELFPKTEKEVFDLLGLEWIDPIWRNADL